MRGVGPNNPVLPVLLQALTEAANEGLEVPSNIELGACIRRSPGTIGDYLAALVAADQVQVRRKSNRRAIKIMATGATTAGWDTLHDPPPRKHAAPEILPVLPVSLRVSCPSCGCRLDADPSLCCARGRELRKLAA